MKMNDLISRQDAINELKKCRDFYCENTPESFSLLEHSDKSRVDEIDNSIAILVNLPCAQPKIIRCQDCRHRYVVGENIKYNRCELNHNSVQSDDWFCADGKEREE